MILETEHGRFEADTESEVLMLARKAKREAEKAEKLKEEWRKQARLYAHENGFRVYDRHLEDGKGFPRGWMCHKPGDKYFPPQRQDEFGIYTLTRIEGEHGTAELELYDRSWRVVATVENGAGYTMTVFIEDTDTGTVRASAVGVCEGQVAIEPMAECITMDLFRQVEQENTALPRLPSTPTLSTT
ncbi:MAG: hypothetical protein ABIP48_18070 [Planctomycetota bacterium]